MEELVSICLGVGLAAACGFRIFVPLLAVSIASMAGHVDLAGGTEWMGTWPALLCFLTATILEIAAYYVPWIDNALDTIATPAAVIAGTIATGAVIDDMSPLMRWSVALIAGGGLAGLIQSATVALRGTSTATTGGLTNFVVSTMELVLAVLTTVLAFLIPLFTVLLVALVVGIALRIILTRRAKSSLAAKQMSPAARAN